jgi:parvulin-like peptidyl-prolyl isomerase
MKFPHGFIFLVSITVFGLAACSLKAPEATPTPTPTIVLTPTETPIPMAAVVNDEGITVSELEAELARYQAAQTGQGEPVSADDARWIVLNDLIDQVLLVQGASEQGYVVDDVLLQARIDALVEQVGGEQALADWQSAHGYTHEEFRISLRRQIAVAWMRDTIAATVQGTAEQVHVKQILFYNEDAARDVWEQLEAGANFDELAALYDPNTQGELGWFPQGYLLEPVIEEAAFALPPGEYSNVLESGVGFHIIMVIERDPAHPLSPDATLTLQIKALEDWLAERRSQSVITMTP